MPNMRSSRARATGGAVVPVAGLAVPAHASLVRAPDSRARNSPTSCALSARASRGASQASHCGPRRLAKRGEAGGRAQPRLPTTTGAEIAAVARPGAQRAGEQWRHSSRGRHGWIGERVRTAPAEVRAGPARDARWSSGLCGLREGSAQVLLGRAVQRRHSSPRTDSPRAGGFFRWWTAGREAAPLRGAGRVWSERLRGTDRAPGRAHRTASNAGDDAADHAAGPEGSFFIERTLCLVYAEEARTRRRAKAPRSARRERCLRDRERRSADRSV